jgi:glycosyltransferase involved in cell wall biosynthesis
VTNPVGHAMNRTSDPLKGALDLGRGDTPPRRSLRIAMVAYSFYETDNRVLRYASALAKRGDSVDVFALRHVGQLAEEVIEGVHVHRLQIRIVNEKSRFSYLWRICQFLLRTMMQVAKQEKKGRYDLIHVHSVPDFLVFSALIPRLRGTPVILDIHDILPEFYTSKFASGEKSGIFRLLVGIERASARFASHVIIANHIWRDRLISRSVASGKCTVVMNYPDPSIFTRRGPSRPTKEKFLMLYPGTLMTHQGLDIAIRAFAKISKQAPQAVFQIYGSGPSTGELMQLIKKLGVEGKVSMHAGCPLREIAHIMETVDLGIVPKRKDNFGNEAFSTKTLEFMAMGVPVIVSDTTIDKYYFNESVVKFFRSGDDDDLARCMLEMIEDSETRKLQIENANRFIKTFDWDARQHEYFELVDGLTRSALA